MKKGLTELIFILDRSGSMGGLEQDTIGGFNAMLRRQKAQEGEAIITTVLFDNQYEKIHDRVPLERVKELTDQEYFVRGSTALLDAMGRTIHEMALIQRTLPREAKAEKVIFVINTDGMENASREYSRARVKAMVEKEKEKYGWEFLFLGANMDAVAEAESFGIGRDRAVTFQNDSRGISLNYQVISETVTRMRCQAATVGADWKEKIEEDYAGRGKKKWQ